MTSPLRMACTRLSIAGLTDGGSFERGELYRDEGRVRLMSTDDRSADAIVRGQEPYRVRLTFTDGLRGTCSCPMGGAGVFCKHCVAVALVVGEEREEPALRAFVSSWSTSRLVDFALEAIARDELLRDRVALQAATADGEGVDADALAAAIDDAVRVDGHVPWQESWAYGERLDAVLDELDRTLEAGNADVVVELVEHFLRTLDGQLEHVDDSQDGVGALGLRRAEELHRRACAAAPQDGPALAERLLELQLASESELLLDALPAGYAGVLGPDGLARYRELVHARWRALPALGPGERDSRYAARFRVTHVAERLAEHDGDVDRLVDIKARDLSDGWAFLRVAETLDGAGRSEEALTWAERGLAELPGDHDARLVDFVADRYLADGRGEEALALRAARFEQQPSFGAYRALHAAATSLGVWAAERDRAMARLRAAQQPEQRGARRWSSAARGHSTLVEILLWEGDASAAWEEAQAGGCTDDLWRALGIARAPTHPDDALAAFRLLVGRALGRADQRAYEHAVELLAELERLLDGSDAFAELVAEVRTANRRRRNLVKLLDARWPPVGSAP